MSEEFIFNELTDDDIQYFVDKSKVFNVSLEEAKNEKITLLSMSDETLGASQEHLDIAIYNDNKWSILDIKDKVQDYNELPLGYLVSDKDFSRILIIVRRMSTLVLDTVKEGSNSYILCIVPDKYKGISKDKALFGLLAKNQVYLDEPEESIKSQIKSKIYDRNDEILSRLF